MNELFDVIAVNLETHAERLMAWNLSAKNADAFITMAVIRRGCEEEFFKAVPHPWQPRKGVGA